MANTGRPGHPSITPTVEPPARSEDHAPSTHHAAGQMVRMASALLSAQATTWLVTLLGLLVVPRYMGTRDFGILATASTVGMFGLAIASLGTTNYLVKEIARRPDEGARIMAGALALRIAAWAALAAVVIPATMLVVDDALIRWTIIILFVGTGFDLLKTGAISGLQARYELGRTAITLGFMGLAAQIVIVALLVMGYQLLPVVLTLAAGSMAGGLFAVFVFWRKFGLTSPMRSGTVRTALTASSIYIGWDLAMIVTERIDILMLSLIAGATATGHYAFAMRLTAIPSFVHTILAGTIFPSLAAHGSQRPEAFRAVLDGAVRILLVTTIPMGVGLALLAPEVTRMVGGAEFAAAWPVVVVMAVVWPLIGVDTVLGTALFAVDRQRAWISVAWGAAILNPVLNLVAIPAADRLWANPGVGAALATGATEVWMGCCAWYFLRGYLSPRPTLRVAVLTLAACAAMTPAVILAEDFGGLVLAVPAGAATYAVAAVALRLVTLGDLEFLRRSWSNRAATSATELAEPAA